MTSSTTTTIIYRIAILALPTLSALYAVSVQCFNAMWHECSWYHLLIPISIRIAILSTSVGIVFITTEEETLRVILTAIISNILSLILIIRIRRIYVVGPKPNIPSLTNKVIMITGANAGIGKETTRQLVSVGATIVMACRSEVRAREAMRDIIQSFPQQQKEVKERLIFLPMDISDITSIKEGVQLFHGMNLPLHVLINNAGIMMGQRKITKSKNWELTMAANHLGHFLLTNLLLPKLKSQKGSRLVILTSSTYELSTCGIDLNDLHCENKPYSMFPQYSQSKLANILMGMELTRRETNRMQEQKQEQNQVMVYCVHPGLVRTDVVKNMQWYLRYPNVMFGFILKTLQKAPPAGAYTSVFCATDESLKDKSGLYFSNSKVEPLKPFARDVEAGKRLWNLSSKFVELDN